MTKRPPPLYARAAEKRITVAMTDTPVVMVNGPRQCGKTTLTRMFEEPGRRYITLDDDIICQAAQADPTGFVRDLDRVIIDEVQRAPDLLLAIKRSVDEGHRPGRFLMTGSANILTIPKVAESLAGRMEIIGLLPLSQSEIKGGASHFLDALFDDRLKAPSELVLGKDLVEAVLKGGYPEMLKREEPQRRTTWARDYIRAIVERDVRDIAEVEKLEAMPKLLRALSAHAGQLTNFSQLGGQLRLDDKTARRYVGLLEQLFLIRRVEPWFRNNLKRLIKTPKLHFLDSGLLAVLSGATPDRIARDRALLGPLLETFVAAEILKHMSWSDRAPRLYHYRDTSKDEVDLVLEDDTGAMVGVEVKAAATVRASDFKGLRKLADMVGDDFRLGVVLYDGDQLVRFGDKLLAAPLSCLWG